jgi:hypothetical protein
MTQVDAKTHRSEVHVFRPSAAAYLGRVGRIGRIVFGGVLVVGTPLLLLGVHSTRLLAVVAVVIGFGVVFAIYIYNVRVVIDGEEVRLYGMFGGLKRWPRSSIKGFKLLEVEFRGVGRSKPIAVAFDNDHRAVFTLEAALWAPDDLRSMFHKLGGWELHETLTNKEAIRRYPGSLNLADRHYWLVGCSLPFVIIGLVFALAPFCSPGPAG